MCFRKKFLVVNVYSNIHLPNCLVIFYNLYLLSCLNTIILILLLLLFITKLLLLSLLFKYPYSDSVFMMKREKVVLSTFILEII